MAKHDALLRHAVEVGRLDGRPAHEPRLIVAEFVGHDIDDVGLRGLGAVEPGEQQDDEAEGALQG